jgi:hypothetical protein
MMKRYLIRSIFPALLLLGVWDTSPCRGQESTGDESVVEQMGESLRHTSSGVTVLTADDMERLRSERADMINRPTSTREEEDQVEEVRNQVLREMRQQ